MRGDERGNCNARPQPRRWIRCGVAFATKERHWDRLSCTSPTLRCNGWTLFWRRPAASAATPSSLRQGMAKTQKWLVDPDCGHDLVHSPKSRTAKTQFERPAIGLHCGPQTGQPTPATKFRRGPSLVERRSPTPLMSCLQGVVASMLALSFMGRHSAHHRRSSPLSVFQVWVVVAGCAPHCMWTPHWRRLIRYGIARGATRRGRMQGASKSALG